jgi:hypothetical protein
MFVSLPSKEVYAINIPEVSEFLANVSYNYFVQDESLNETSGVPTALLNRSSADDIGNYSLVMKLRVPRYVAFSWGSSTLKTPGNVTTDTDTRTNSLKNSTIKRVITDNYDKIVSEEHFASLNFVAVTYNDNDIDEKLHAIISGSYAQLTLGESQSNQTSMTKAASNLSSKFPNKINANIV